ncbi:MAG: hypothetical protein ACK5M7_10415 [Draconibacterium sp.]
MEIGKFVALAFKNSEVRKSLFTETTKIGKPEYEIALTDFIAVPNAARLARSA